MIKPKMDNDYQEFLEAEQAKPSLATTEKIFAAVYRDLRPGALSVFSKLLAIHFVTALITLSICPQFGFRIVGEGMGLMHLFMGLGTYGCLAACGAFFTGTSLLIAGLSLRGEELRKIRENRWLGLGVLTLLSLGFFIMIDAELIFGLTLTWFVGAMLGSLGILELTWWLRFQKQYA